MPICPKCVATLTKRKSTNAYHCKRHGLVRKINSPTRTDMPTLYETYKDEMAQSIYDVCAGYVWGKK